jgi:hypothetical protein
MSIQYREQILGALGLVAIAPFIIALVLGMLVNFLDCATKPKREG